MFAATRSEHTPAMTTTDYVCSGCGAPITVPPGTAHVDCPFCGVTNAVASAGAVKVAKVLERHGIRMPERPVSPDEIRAQLEEQRAAEEATRRQAIVMAGVFSIVVLVVIGALMALSD